MVLTGPTGAGKSLVGVELAERLGAEIVAMDSMSLYRGLDIGTAKPAAAARRRVAHHLVDVREPWESASVAWWLEQAAACCRAIEARGQRVLFVGGTPLYLKALLFGLFDGPPANAALREQLQREADAQGADILFQRLQAVDPPTAGRVHANDVRRVIRALEVWELTGRPISAWQTQWRSDSSVEANCKGRADQACDGTAAPGFPRILCLDLPRAELYARINARVEDMIARGWEEEVRRLLSLPQPLGREASQALGYPEMIALVQGQRTRAAAIERIQARSRQFAKRQLTWFRRLPGCRFVAKELTFATWGLTMTGRGCEKGS